MKPREWWIGWNNTVNPINHDDETLDTKYHVIEHSAYLAEVEKCKVLSEVLQKLYNCASSHVLPDERLMLRASKALQKC